MKLLFFDTETTGVKPGSICQLSYILVDTSTKPQKTIGKNIFFTVDEMEPEAERIHGFSLEKLYELSEGMYFEDLYADFINDFLEADFIIGHNVQFDIKFLKHELLGLGEFFEPNNVFCTMKYYKDICKILRPTGDYKNPKLEEVIKHLNITDSEISETANNYIQASGNYHEARFDKAETNLTDINGIKKGLIPRNYFTKLLEAK